MIFFLENYKDFTISFNHILEIILNKKGILCKKKQKEKSSNFKWRPQTAWAMWQNNIHSYFNQNLRISNC